MSFGVVYPDVLGAITGGKRVVSEDLQYAVGLSSGQAYINQPIEVILPLQNMVNKPLQVKVALRMPNRDKKGNPVFIESLKSSMTINMRPGEVGLIRIPITAHPPTPAGKGYPVQVAVRYITPKEAERVRPPDGGPPPSVLSISPFRLQVMKEVEFETKSSGKDVTTVTFDLAPKRLPKPDTSALEPKYETIWSSDEMKQEEELARSRIDDARRIALGRGHPTSYWDLLEQINERFADRGIPLHPGEASAIAKVMAYTVDEAPELETQMDVEESHWFRTLCQVLAHDAKLVELPRSKLIAEHVFDAVLFDAILMGFHIVQPKVKEQLGNKHERQSYANKVMTWFAGYGEPDLTYIYLPLVLAGLIVYRIVTLNVRENPWVLVDDLNEAMQGRKALSGEEETTVVFSMLENLLNEQARVLRSQRIDRPT